MKHFNPLWLSVPEEVLVNMHIGLKKFIPLTCFSKAYCLAEWNRMWDRRKGNLVLKKGTLKVREKYIKVPEESTQNLEDWKDSMTHARDVYQEELDIGDGKDGPVMKYIVSQYIGWFDYWLNYPHLEQFWSVLKEWNLVICFNMWKSNLHDLMPINEAEWNYRINMEKIEELKKLKKWKEAAVALTSASPKTQAKPSQPPQQLRQKFNTTTSLSKGTIAKERAVETDFRCMTCRSDKHIFSQHPKMKLGSLIT